MEKKLNNKLIVLACILFFAGCTINYNDDQDIIEKSESIPDSVMENFRLIQIKENTPYTEIYTSKTEIYDTQNKTLLYNAKFTEYNTKNKEISTQGEADFIEYYNDTEDAKLTGNLNFYSQKDEIEMTGDYLYWTNETKTISSLKESSILVVKDDGSRMEGYGFSANVTRSTFSFQNKVSGVTK